MDESRRQAAEALKDLLLEEKRSRWPLVLGLTALLILLAAGGAWFYLPPSQRPQLDVLAVRAKSFTKNLLNAPIMNASKAPSLPASTPSAPAGMKSSAPSDDNTLLSK